jgi:hypothetical protein
MDKAEKRQRAQDARLSQRRCPAGFQRKRKAHSKKGQAINKKNQKKKNIERLIDHRYSPLGILHQYPGTDSYKCNAK